MLGGELKLHHRVLRHSPAPYLAFAIPMFFVTGLGALAALKAGTWGFFGYVLVPWIFYVPWVVLLRRYRIAFTETAITRWAPGLQPLTIEITAIRSVRLEVRDLTQILSIARPFRRITIYACKHGDNGDFIDVSLKHFVRADIRDLMRAIHIRRPDLALPKKWL